MADSVADPDLPVTHYAKSGDVSVAPRVFGDGPTNLIIAPGFSISHIENTWTEPICASFLRQLGRVARVAMFDNRGTGLPDPVGVLPGLDELFRRDRGDGFG